MLFSLQGIKFKKKNILQKSSNIIIRSAELGTLIHSVDIEINA